MSAATVQRECLWTVQDEIPALFERHWREIGLHRERVPLAPNWPQYRALEQADVLRVFTARAADDRELVGYLWMTLAPGLHYARTRFAINDLFYVLPAWRTAWLGLRLLRLAERELAAEGAEVMLMNEKLAHPMTGLLRRAGFRPVERVHAKLLEG